MTAAQFDFHPDMAELLAAKEALPQGNDRNTLRAGWNNYAASMQRPYPAGMVVADMKLACPGAGTDGQIMVRFYRPPELPAPSACVVYLLGAPSSKAASTAATRSPGALPTR